MLHGTWFRIIYVAASFRWKNKTLVHMPMPTDINTITTSSNGKRQSKQRLLTRQSLDGRSRARKQYDAIVFGIAQDLGGEDRLSTVQCELVEAFAGVAVWFKDLNARLLLGQQVDPSEIASAVNSMVKVASRIGVTRIARDITPDLQTYLASREAAE
jgi:hypothetical protein